MYQPFFSYQREACGSAVVPEAAALDPASEVAGDVDDVAELLPPPDEAFCP